MDLLFLVWESILKSCYDLVLTLKGLKRHGPQRTAYLPSIGADTVYIYQQCVSLGVYSCRRHELIHRNYEQDPKDRARTPPCPAARASCDTVAR